MRVEVNLFRERKVSSGRGASLKVNAGVYWDGMLNSYSNIDHECSTVDSFYSLSYECMGPCVYVHACSVTNHGTYVEVGGLLLGVSFSLLLCKLQASDLSESVLHAELSCSS